MENNVNELKQWHKLLEAGIISQEEFDAKKNEILGISTNYQNNFEETEKVLASEEPFSEKIEMQPVAKPIQTNYKKTFQKKTSLNANQIFLIVLGGLLLIIGGWLWWRNSNSKQFADIKNNNTISDSTAIIDYKGDDQNIHNLEISSQEKSVKNIDSESKNLNSTEVDFSPKKLQPTNDGLKGNLEYLEESGRLDIRWSPNFAKYYEIVIWGCGTGCVSSFLVDLRDGKIYNSKLGVEKGDGDIPADDSYNIGSNILETYEDIGENRYKKMKYEWDEVGKKFKEVSSKINSY